MRKLFAFVLLLLSLAVSAQTDKTFMSVDWDKIKAEVKANPQHVQQLVDILINVDADTTLTAEDKILAVYGRTYLNNGRDMFMELDMSKARNEGKFDVTHSGILYRRQGQWWVIHSLSSDVSETDGMQQQPLATFLNYSMPEKILVVRPQGLTSEQGLKVVERALYYLQKGVPFDHRGVIDDPSELYCTELIYQILENDLHYLTFPQDRDQRKDAFYSMTTLYNPKYFRIVINTYKESKK